MAEGVTDTGAQYGTVVGLVYIFNLIVGTGALTMPAAFQEAGWLVSLILIVLLAFISYVTVTIVTEVMAVANAVLRMERHGSQASHEEPEDTKEEVPLLQGRSLEGSLEVKQQRRTVWNRIQGVLEAIRSPSLHLQASPGSRKGDTVTTPDPKDGKLITSSPKNLGKGCSEVSAELECLHLEDRKSEVTLEINKLKSQLVGTGVNHVDKAEQGQGWQDGTAHKIFNDVDKLFDISERIEMGKMAKMFFNSVGEKLFYLCLVIYLYGDMSIYVAAVPKSLRDTVCTWRPFNETNCNKSLSDTEPCWTSSSLTRLDAYRIFVACFILALGPFVFFNVQKTKILQVITGSARWLAFGIMIVLAVMQLAQHKGEGRPAIGNIAGVPNLFGVCVYSFMCHHSLPSLITPIKDKSKLYKVLAADYILILSFYALLSFTGIYTFKSIQDLYTLNFLPDECGNNSVTSVKFVQYFLALFPVFTLSTNFPIIAITLRNNLQTLFLKPDRDNSKYVRNLFPILAVIPPTIVAMVTNEVEILVGITGSYAGAGIQYVIPALLVYFARKDPLVTEYRNYHRSPFSHVGWIILILAWSVICVGFVTVNHIITRK